jgi:hypothetical protein
LADRAVTIVSSPSTYKEARDSKYIIVGSPTSALDQSTKDFLEQQFKAGKIILATDAFLAREWRVASGEWQLGLYDLPTVPNKLYVIDVGGF